MRKLIKQNLRFYSKLALLIGSLIAFICSFGVSTYAWHEDTIGNLVSDNLIDNSTSVFEMGAVSYNVGLTYSQNKVSSNARIRTINLINVDSTKTYSLSVPSPYLVIAQGYNNDLNVNAIGTQFNQALSSLSFTGVSQVSIIVRKSDNTNFSGVSDISNIDLMFNEGSPKAYEDYGATYYPYSRVRREAYTDYGVYQFIDNIKIEYNTGSSIGVYNTYTSPILSNPFASPLSFTSGNLVLSYDILNQILGGSSNWYYVLTITFQNNRVKISDFNQWNISTVGNNLTFLSYSNTTYTKSNATGISYSVVLTENGFNSSEYLKSITLNVTGYANNNMFTRIGSPNDSLSYMYGYNEGLKKGKDIGFDDGFTDGKNEGYLMGYNDGYRDGEESDFTTNGFKTLIGSIFNYPINMIRSVFNFEFMGINIYSIIVFIMSIGIVIFVIRRFKK